MTKQLRVHYMALDYDSHWKTACDLAEIIDKECQLVDEVQDAHVAIIHVTPYLYPFVIKRFPELKKKYLVGYAYWEATSVPVSYREGIARMHEVWTPATYSFNSFSKHHPRVHIVPHVVQRDLRVSGAALQMVGRLIGNKKNEFFYLFITRAGNRRKNTRQVVESIFRVREKLPHARLIIKDRYDRWMKPDYPLGREGVIYINQEFTDEEVNALYKLSDVYVSAHHSEGWGLTLSDAILFEKPVVATAYSGNMEFMDQASGFLVRYQERRIRSRERFFVFHGNMSWAYPDRDDLVRQMIAAHDACRNGSVRRVTDAAFKRVQSFSRERVAEIVRVRLKAICRRLRI